MANPTGRGDRVADLDGLTKRRLLESLAVAQAAATLTIGQSASITTSGSGPFTVNVQVIDQNGDHLSDYYWVRFTIGTTDYANDATGGITYNVESAHWEYSDGTADVLTNSSGICEIEVTASADRYVTASVLGSAQSSGLLTYSAPGAYSGEPIGLLLALTYA